MLCQDFQIRNRELKKIRSLDVSLTGTIKVIMKNGYETYTSRRNVAKLKELLLRGKKLEAAKE